MSDQAVKILVVEENQQRQQQLDEHILSTLGYEVHTTNNATAAIHKAMEINPDIIIANIDLSGLSGKDMLIALSSQGIQTPVILLAEEGMEQEAIRAFRLGAVDYLSLPLKETEVVSAVQRVLAQPRREETTALPPAAKHKIAHLEERIKELTKVIRVAKTLTSLEDPKEIFRKSLESALHLIHADRGWLMLREYHNPKYILRIYRNLPQSIASIVGKPWDDGITSLVLEAEHTLRLDEIKSNVKEISKLGKTALAVPVWVEDDILGTLILLRIEKESFTRGEQKIAETIADFTAISLGNSGFFEITKPEA